MSAASRDRLRAGGSFCSAPNCTNARYKKSCRGKSFFRFPAEEERCRVWVQNCRRADLLSRKAQYLNKVCSLCSDHFEENQFTTPEKKRINWNAVPTIFDVPNPPLPMTTTRPAPKDRLQPAPPSKKKKRCAPTSADCHPEPAVHETGSSGSTYRAPSYLRDIQNPDWIPTVNLGDDPSDGVKDKRKHRRRQKGSAAASAAAVAETKVSAAKASSIPEDADISLDGGDVAAADTESAKEQLLAVATPSDTGLGGTEACAVAGCPNTSEQLQRWWRGACPLHKGTVGQDTCQCQPPFTLRPFPTNHPSLRDLWITQVRQTLPEEDKMWEPDEQSRVCSEHFAPGGTFPTLRLHTKTEPSLAPCRLQQSASGGGVPEEKRRRVEGDPLALSPSGDEGKDASSPWNPAVALADSGMSALPSCGPAARGAPRPPTSDVADLSSSRTCSSSAPTVEQAPPSMSACRDCLAKDKVIQHMQSEIWALQEEVEAIKEKLRKSHCGSVIGYKAM